MRRAIGAALLLALTITGCGADKPAAQAPAATPSATATTPPTAQRYQTVEALRDAAVAAGMLCPTWVQDNVVVAAAESGTCSEDSVLSTYATAADLQLALENLQGMNELAKENKIPVDPQLIGANWIINAPGADKLAPKLGGTVER
ncbi:hypothetical protein [Kribbella sp. VKM Ac-2566]|uniref:hypothetical protein n=1 Tax=Kribbella sp. VKM Ac-2566 TaxID=2512218 RepID=UPI001062ABEA|nr:hypothetical protein [Kribbella sp. VKM Ac-2566]TDX03986.1 hypothetical protein EV647_2237 [Kribbella sp. VKM Ac-2566]